MTVLTWETVPDSGQPNAMAFVAGHGFYGIDNTADGTYQFSANALAWSTQAISGSYRISRLAHDPLTDTLVGSGGFSAAKKAVRSLNGGGTWAQQTTPWDGAGGFTYGIDWSPSLGIFACSGTNFTTNYASRIMTSPDGVTWTGHTAPWGRFDGVDGGLNWVEEEGLWLLGDSGGDVYTSPDAVNWTHQTPGLDTFLQFAYLAGVGIVACTTDDAVFSTDGGVTWTVAATAFNRLTSLCIFDGRAYFCGRETVGFDDYATVYSTADMVTFEQEFVTSAAGSGDGIAASGSRVAAAVSAASDLVYVSNTSFETGPVTPLWRFFVADLDGFGITDYSKLASDRFVEVVLNAPLSLGGTVPSDDPQVWIPYDGDGYDDPYLAEGTRIMWGFRRESNSPPYYTVRAATLVQLVEDTAEQDNARTRFQGWDPWHYLLSRPVVNADGDLPGKSGLSYTNTQASVIVAQLLRNTIDAHGFAYIDAGTTYSGSSDYDGTLETAAGMVIDEINFQQGTSVGQAWQQVANLGQCDIVLDPIYDPSGRSFGSSTVYNYLCQLNVYAQAGVTRDEQIFAWNMPGRSLVGLTRQEDGSVRANNVQFYAGQGGSYGKGVLQTDAASVAKYGEYWAEQFFPAQIEVTAVTSLAEQQLALRKNGRTTVTFKPAPERSPRPWQDYQLGDRVPAWASTSKFRQNMSGPNPLIDSASNGSSWFVIANGDFRTDFPDGAQFVAFGAGTNTGAWVVASTAFVGGDTRVVTTVAPANAGAGGNLAVSQYQRLYGWRANVSDDALETLDPVLTSPQGFTG